MRDGAYVLPNSEGSREVFDEQSADIVAAGGAAHVVSFEANSEEQQQTLVELFDRTGEYTEAMQRLQNLKDQLTKVSELDARQELNSIAREVTLIVGRDFFPGEPRKQMEGALTDVECAINVRFAPDEPHAAKRGITRRERKNYRGKSWATRERLWIDRVASAWLIRRFIDPDAKFLWLSRVKECPKRAVGFDFDGAEFTHVDSKVTFEALMSSFDLEADSALIKLGALVHHLDVGGIPVAERPGLTTIMTGARALQKDDDALLKAMTPVFDSLYAGYAKAGPKSG
ncbi:MAG: hypothetical protein JWO04_637 [Gammaproteobacteria bacterium]|nr:hypothetical protein [Gammaproteobacteria bacterium]